MKWPEEYEKRGDEIRREAYNKYHIKAELKARLLPHQEIKAYHGGMITTDYYIFTFTDRENRDKKGVFYCGEHAANKWFDLNGQNNAGVYFNDPIDVEIDLNIPDNPNIPNIPNVPNVPNVPNNPNIPRNENKLALIKCLHTYITITNSTEDRNGNESVAIKVISRLITNINQEPTISEIRSVNTILAKTFNSEKYQKKGIENYRQLVENKELELKKENPLIKIKRINLNHFNDIINETAHSSKNKEYIYRYPASF
ncbi:hypothetical protein [Providencia alcalifaciens]|uniref:hypothetical protein n=1 Tax=Providencia alcalifaciens TaxID=126385 RepID=UPI00029C4565|nr:hypothetical protein [Providencia alcalifaciens]EKT61723.1 hypothetical protein OO9_19500 [Providencia alcalifaciens Dmel2]